jgi:glucosylceramidase
MRRALKVAAALAIGLLALSHGAPVDAKKHHHSSKDEHKHKAHTSSGSTTYNHHSADLTEHLAHKHAGSHQRHSSQALSGLAGRGISVHQTHQPSSHALTQIESLPIQQRNSHSKEKADRSADQEDSRESSPQSLLRINVTDVRQSIIGFGGAITEAAVTVLSKMPTSAVQEVIEAYYSEKGNQYSLGRLHINSCDFSEVGQWSFDNHTDDFNLTHFDHNLTHEQDYLLPFLHQVQKVAVEGFKLFASPWSPPAWMKTNEQMNGSDQPGLKEDPRYHRVWAKYLSTWFTAMKNQGVKNLWGMTVQNEPEYAAPWEACAYTAEQERDFIVDHLGPRMRADHPDLTLIAFDHNKDHVALWADAIFGSNATEYVQGIGVHWYSGDEFAHLSQTHSAWPSKFILATEATNVGSPILGDVGRAEAYAHDIIGDLNNWVGGWTDWNIVLDMQGGPNHLGNWCDAPIIADTSAGKLHYQPMYYYLGHFSRFLPPNDAARRVGHEMKANGDSAVEGLELVAFIVDRPQEEQEDAQADEASDEETSQSKQKTKNRKSSSKKHSSRSVSSSSDSSVSTSSSSSGQQIVLIVLNRQDTEASFQLELADGELEAIVTAPAHSIQTLTFDAKLA